MKYLQFKSQLFSMNNQELEKEKFNQPFSFINQNIQVRNYDIILTTKDLEFFFQVKIGRKKTNFMKAYLAKKIKEILVTEQMNTRYLSEVDFYKSEFERNKRISPIVHYIQGPIVESLDDSKLNTAVLEKIFVQIRTINLNQSISYNLESTLEKIKNEFQLQVQEKKLGLNYQLPTQTKIENPFLNQNQILSNSTKRSKFLSTQIPIDTNTVQRIEQIIQASQRINEHLKKTRINKR